MKKISLLFIGLLLSATGVFAQVEFGIQFSPTLVTTRVNPKTDALDYDNFKSGVRFSAGPVIDFFLKKNIAVSTGLWYTVKRTGITERSDMGNTNYRVNTQYLQVPINFKLYTQEIVAGTKFYVNLGGSIDFKIAKDKVQINDQEVINAGAFTKFFDAGLLVGIGTEIKVGSQNKVFGGIYYNRSLINVVTNDFNSMINSDLVKVNPDLFGLMMGYKF